MLLAGTTVPEPLPVPDLVEADLWDQLPADLEDVLTLLPRADRSLQDERQVAFHPTLRRVWSRKGRRGQRLVEAAFRSSESLWLWPGFTGVLAGSMAVLLLDAPLLSFANKYVLLSLVQSSEDE